MQCSLNYIIYVFFWSFDRKSSNSERRTKNRTFNILFKLLNIRFNNRKKGEKIFTSSQLSKLQSFFCDNHQIISRPRCWMHHLKTSSLKKLIMVINQVKIYYSIFQELSFHFRFFHFINTKPVCCAGCRCKPFLMHLHHYAPTQVHSQIHLKGVLRTDERLVY